MNRVLSMWGVWGIGLPLGFAMTLLISAFSQVRPGYYSDQQRGAIVFFIAIGLHVICNLGRWSIKCSKDNTWVVAVMQFSCVIVLCSMGYVILQSPLEPGWYLLVIPVGLLSGVVSSEMCCTRYDALDIQKLMIYALFAFASGVILAAVLAPLSGVLSLNFPALTDQKPDTVSSAQFDFNMFLAVIQVALGFVGLFRK